MKKIHYTLKGVGIGIAFFLLVVLLFGFLVNVFGGIEGLFLFDSSSDKQNEGASNVSSNVLLYRHDIRISDWDLSFADFCFTIYNSDPTNYTSHSEYSEDDSSHTIQNEAVTG